MKKSFILCLTVFLLSYSLSADDSKEITGTITDNEIIFDVSELNCYGDLDIANKTRTKATFYAYSLDENNHKTLLGSRTLGGDNTEAIRPKFNWDGIKKICITVEPSSFCIDKYYAKADKKLYVKFSSFLPKFEYTDKINNNDAFLNAKVWIAENLLESKYSLQLEDKDSGLIIGKGYFIDSKKGNMFQRAFSESNALIYTFKIKIQDSKATLSFFNFIQNYDNENTSYEQFSVYSKELSESFFKSLN